jgi:hypothetical protein
MLPENPKNDPHDSIGKRQDYLSKPYNDPIRRQFRGMEAYYGQLFQAENEKDANDGGFFAAAFAALGAAGGFLTFGAPGVFAGVLPALEGGRVFLGPGIGEAASPVGTAIGAALGAAAGAGYGATVNVRYLSLAEWAFAQKVFANSLPDRETILLTDMSGLGGRGFTVPVSSVALLGTLANPALATLLLKNSALFAGKIFVNIGPAFANPTRYTSSSYPTAGQLLIHELTHAWQIRYSQTALGFLCEGIVTQAGNSGGSAYRVQPGNQWKDYGLEQQATLVDTWFQKGAVVSAFSSYYAYIEKNIRPGDPNATSIIPTISKAPASTVSRLVGKIGTPIRVGP